MAGKKQDDKPNGDQHYEGAPGAKEEAPTSDVVNFSQFEAELAERADQYASMLPSTLPKQRFVNMAIAAIKQNPDLLKATKRSLFAAISHSAQDGIPPDGKHGVITAYNTKVKRKKPGTNAWEDHYENQAVWNPMAQGMRKRARELDGILVDAQVVYANDFFEREQGDEPKIIHRPAPLDKDPGSPIGAYAVFKREDGTILHREVMNKAQIEATREQSQAKNSLMWTTFLSEGYKKTVVRRGFKSVPVSDDMLGIIQRDDERNFDFDHAAPKQISPPPAPPPAPLQTAIEHKPQVPMTPPPAKPDGEPVAAGKEGKAAKKPAAAKKNKPAPEPEKGPETLADHIGDQEEGADEERAADEPAEKKLIPDDWQMYLDRQFDEWQAITDASTAHGVTEAVNDAVQGAEERGEIDKQQSEAINQKWDAMISANG